jgi:hypothetical protein
MGLLCSYQFDGDLCELKTNPPLGDCSGVVGGVCSSLGFALITVIRPF